MNLSEFGFHKCAGVQADLYRLTKPLLTKALNARTKKDVLQGLRESKILPQDIHNYLRNTGVLKSVIDGGEKNLAAKVTAKGIDQISGKLGRYPHNIDPVAYPVPIGRTTDLRYGPEQRQNSWLHLRGIDPNAANKSGDRRRGF